MKIITIATQKGGAGKTTLATNLAVAYSKTNKVIMIIDADARQQTATEWFNKRDDQENPIVITAKDLKSLKALLKLAKEKGIERVIIDTPGTEANLVNEAIKQADFCLIPCSIGGFDIGAQRSTALAIHELNQNKKSAFIITKTAPRGQETNDTKAILSGLGLPLSEHSTSNLKVYREAALRSSSVIELEPNSKAAGEIIAMTDWVEKKLNKSPLLETMEAAAND